MPLFHALCRFLLFLYILQDCAATDTIAPGEALVGSDKLVSSNGKYALGIFQTGSDAEILNWNTRYQIALGIARGLAYLHESCRDCIIHCDVKPQNILLDESFISKIADFGMAKFLGREISRALTTIRGTIGYLAPEWISGGAITPKVDVYSYGMLLLEIVSGRKNSHRECTTTGDDDTYFPVQVASKLLVGDIGSLVDDKLHGDVHLNEAERVCILFGCLLVHSRQ
ncbi:unnamed protein product [Miscanthus lutarioriparius]|uniref:Protein kinase domain-containing protein n=1 Tax=Miscanthus lutarioriparius TaxID=422564 RepID=A0A811QWU7_9POAL|nr:unnamed protein product [Miscanthus lutarioriparius]